MKPAQKKNIFKASAFLLLIGILAAALYISSSEINVPGLAPVAAFGAGFALASVIFLVVLKKRTFGKLIEAFDRASIGDFSYRIRDAKGVPKDLAEAFNRMARRLERRFRALEGRLEEMDREMNLQEDYRERCEGLEKKLAETQNAGESSNTAKTL